MDLTTSSADWMSHFEMEEHDYSHGWEIESPSSFRSSVSLLQHSHGDCSERATKLQKTNSSSPSSSTELHHFSGGSGVISFGSSSPFEHNSAQLHQFDVKPPKLERVVSGDLVGFVEGPAAHGSGGVLRRTGGSGGDCNYSGAKEHVIAERKRREKLSHGFIHLSSLLPGLKKMDKASVLGEAARYVKQLQEQVKAVEDQKPSKRAVIGRSPKTNSSIEDGNMSSSSSSSDSSSSGDHPLPEIEARFSDKEALIRVQCMKKQGIVPKVLDEIQKLHLSIVNCNAMPFGKSAMVVTVVAEMNDEFSASSMELVNMIRQSLQTLT